MGVIGGICMVIIHLLNDERRNRLGLFTVMLVSSAFILSAELLSGEILNRTLDLNIWSYKDQPLNIDGQICAVYAALWFGLSFIAVVVDEWVRMKIFHEPNLPIFIRKAKRTAV
ncbi:MAG: putative ABC transporter permease [Ruminococcus sp.]|nr:putative ABC transporter permease [Ruminococcus sp.]